MPLEPEVELWQTIQNQETHIFNELATALIGVGALFFAYAQLHSDPTRVLIAILGFAGSAVLYVHVASAARTRAGAYEYLWKCPKSLPLMEAIRESQAWSGTTLYGKARVSASRAAEAFMGWTAVAWMLLLVSLLFPAVTQAISNALGWTTPYLAAAVVIAIGMATYLCLHAEEKFILKQRGFRTSSSPTNSCGSSPP